MSKQPSVEQVETLRDLFMKKCEKEPIPCGKFHPKDVERVQTNNLYVGNFLEHNDLDMKLALQMLWDVCIWRKNFGTNDIDESNIRMDYLNQGLVFPRNTDKDGKTLLIFKTRNHTKGSKDMGELLRVVVYWFERVFAENNLDKISVFFDMQGTSVGNVDMELIKKIIEILKMYPLPLNYILIFEMPWILNAAFKIIKALLPPKAVAIMKFLNQKTISEYVPVTNMLACWGGKDNYTFSFEPAQPNKNGNLSSTCDGEKSVNNNEENFETRSSIRKVHFANSSPTKVSMSDAEEHLTPHDEDMLRISPRNVIVLSKPEDSTDEDLIGTVEITCTSKYPITYKIKTTSPLKFRVRPSAGALNPGSTVSINVILQPGKQVSSANKDKFLVMCTALPDDVDINNSQFITDFWKGLPPNSPNVQQHRLQCVNSQAGGLLRNGQMHGSDEFGDKNCSNNEVAQLSNNVRRLERQMKLSINLHWISLLVFIIVSIALTYILKQEIQEQNQGSCSKFK